MPILEGALLGIGGLLMAAGLVLALRARYPSIGGLNYDQIIRRWNLLRLGMAIVALGLIMVVCVFIAFSNTT